jgi:hypothetical protein
MCGVERNRGHHCDIRTVRRGVPDSSARWVVLWSCGCQQLCAPYVTGLAFVGDPVVDTLEWDERDRVAGGSEDAGSVVGRVHGVKRGWSPKAWTSRLSRSSSRPVWNSMAMVPDFAIEPVPSVRAAPTSGPRPAVDFPGRAKTPLLRPWRFLPDGPARWVSAGIRRSPHIRKPARPRGLQGQMA